MRTLLCLSYTFGFRKAELLNMKVGQVDLFAETILLNPGETKNGEGRKVSLTADGKNPLADGKNPLAACVTAKGPEASVFTQRLSWNGGQAHARRWLPWPALSRSVPLCRAGNDSRRSPRGGLYENLRPQDAERFRPL
jgi:integrase